eukprot:COSAG01_NODE_1077_length_11839_cov_52.054093_6_plen_175_part_00
MQISSCERRLPGSLCTKLQQALPSCGTGRLVTHVYVCHKPLLLIAEWRGVPIPEEAPHTWREKADQERFEFNKEQDAAASIGTVPWLQAAASAPLTPHSPEKSERLDMIPACAPTYGAALPWRCPRRSPSAHERGHLTAGYRGGSCATTRRGHRPDTRSITALVAEYSAGAQRP